MQKNMSKQSRAYQAFKQLLKVIARGAREAYWKRRQRGVIRAYLAAPGEKRLQVGAGENFLAGWLNTDIYPDSPAYVFLDATRPFPFSDASFDCMFAEHVIEHMTYAEGRNMLAEWYRIMKPGGRCRIVTPALETFVGLFKPQHTEAETRYLRWHMERYWPGIPGLNPCLVINNSFRSWGHRFIYDRPTLERALTDAGFEDVRFYASQESDSPALRGIEVHGKVIGNDEVNAFEMMAVEARRPLT